MTMNTDLETHILFHKAVRIGARQNQYYHDPKLINDHTACVYHVCFVIGCV